MIGDEARAQILEREGRLPDRVIACVGGGSNAIGIFAPFVGDAGVELIGVEAAGRGARARPPRRAADGRRAPRRAARIAVGRAAGRDGPDPRGALDLGRPGLSRAAGPSTPTCATSGARATSPSATPRRWTTFRRVTRLEGIIPALETAHALHYALAPARLRARHRVLLGPRRQGPGRGPRAGMTGGAEAIAAAFAGDGRRAALMPYMMGGFPDMDDVAAHRRGLRRRRRRPRRAGRPVQRPAGRRPRHPRRRDRGAARGRDDPRGARRRARAGRARAGGGDGLREPRAGARRSSASPTTRRARRSPG